jgi:hypothetical protein
MFSPAQQAAGFAFRGVTTFDVERCSADRAWPCWAGSRDALEEMARLIWVLVRVALGAEHFNVRRVVAKLRIAGERLNVMAVQELSRPALLALTLFKNTLCDHFAALATRLLSPVDIGWVISPSLVRILASRTAEAGAGPVSNAGTVLRHKEGAAASLAIDGEPHLLSVRPLRAGARQRARGLGAALCVRQVGHKLAAAMGAIQTNASGGDQLHAH